jgi:hypothetical protein
MQRRPFRPAGEFRFDRPLTLQENIVVHTLSEAAAFTRSYTTPRLPMTRDSLLRWLDRDAAENQLATRRIRKAF